MYGTGFILRVNLSQLFGNFIPMPCTLGGALSRATPRYLYDIIRQLVYREADYDKISILLKPKWNSPKGFFLCIIIYVRKGLAMPIKPNYLNCPG